ncbi:MAG: hypothetical protein HY203_10175 [Nitrospirae bacterium]|nr:hypothetical protein [Nitrospirota bacterium]
MVITKKTVADQILKYVNRKISLADLVDWAEDAVQEGDFDKRDVGLLRQVVGRLGLADVKEFGLTWDDCYEHLHKLGYDISVSVSKTA